MTRARIRPAFPARFLAASAAVSLLLTACSHPASPSALDDPAHGGTGLVVPQSAGQPGLFTVLSSRLEGGVPAILGGLREVQFPYAKAVTDGKRRALLLSVNTNVDSLKAKEQFVSLRSTDDGRSWTHVGPTVPFSSVWADARGHALAFNLRSRPGTSPTSRTVPYWSTADLGSSWTRHDAVLTAPFPLRSAYFNRDVLTASDGSSLIATVYGQRAGTPRNEVWIARSSDHGATWRIVSTAASPESFGSLRGQAEKGEGYSEPSMARLPDGRLMIAIRQRSPVNPWICSGAQEGSPIATRVSSDDGATWTPPALVYPGDGSLFPTADPQLLVSGGRVLLSAGRPSTVVLSADPVQAERPEWRTDSRHSPATTSGYTTLVPTGRSYLLFGDSGSNWCFSRSVYVRPLSIWMRRLTLPGS